MRRTAPAWGFVPVEAAGSYETVANAYFCGRGACAQYDPKVLLGAKNLRNLGVRDYYSYYY